MSDSSYYFTNYFYTDNTPVASTKRYSDVVFYNVEDALSAGFVQPESWRLKNQNTRGEIELSKQALVFTVDWDPKQETDPGLQIGREVSLGSFIFEGNLLKSASITSSIQVFKDGSFKGKKYSTLVSLSDWNLLQVDELIETRDGVSITSLNGYEKYFPDLWYDDPFSKSIISIDDDILGDESDNNLSGGDSVDKFIASAGDDIIDGGAGIDTTVYSGKFSDYSFTREANSLNISDQRTDSNHGTDTLSNIEYIQFSDQTVEESKVDVVKTYTGNFSDYKFYNKGDGKYEIKTDSGYDDITGYPSLKFSGEASTSSFHNVSAISDIKGTFDQVTGLNTDDAKMFRLYNAAFKRLPDADGLKYWIGNFSSGIDDERAVSSSFLDSAEFKERYGNNITHETYVQKLYLNVLNRELDQGGYDYWVGNLNNGVEQRHEVLLGFSESDENKLLFTKMTGFG